jgi:methylmalonyl-CoA/ethylmalonyl-CoA epimerase
MITGLSHVSIVVPSLEVAAKRLKEVYGLEVGAARANEQQGVRLAYVELSKFLEKNPAGGIHHFCLAVDDVPATAAGIAGRGARVLGDGREQRNVHGERIAFVHPKDFLGALVELEESKAEGERRKPKGSP